MTTLREELRGLIVKYGVVSVNKELQAELRETYDALRKIFDPPKNNLVIPMAQTIPDRIATPLHKPVVGSLAAEAVGPELPSLQLDTPVIEKDPSLKDVIIQAKSEMNKQLGEKFSKANHKEEVGRKHKELTEKGIKPESLLTKENLTQWLGSGMSYMRIARELTGVPENEVAAIAKTFGLQSDVKKYIVMRKGGK